MTDPLEDQIRRLDGAPLPTGADDRIARATRVAQRPPAGRARRRVLATLGGLGAIAAGLLLVAMLRTTPAPEPATSVATTMDRAPKTIVLRYDLLAPAQPQTLRISDWSHR